MAQERLERSRFPLCAIHVFFRALEIVLPQRIIRGIDVAVHPIHRSQDIAADVEPLRLLLAAYLLHAAPCSVGPRAEVHQPVMSLTNLLR